MANVDLKLHEAMVIAMVRRRRFKMPAQELADAVREPRRILRRLDYVTSTGSAGADWRS